MKGFSNFPENFCVEWVQMRKYLACVFYMPILLRICRSESAHWMQTFPIHCEPSKTTSDLTSTFLALSLPFLYTIQVHFT